MIDFNYECDFSLDNEEVIASWLSAVIVSENKKEGEINYIFCDDEYLLQLNQQHLKHNTYTDIITFPLSSKGEPLIAEIYISIDRVKENAEKFKVPFLHELYRVIFHGALHLCGYKDKGKAEVGLMRKKEDQYLKRYLVPRGT